MAGVDLATLSQHYGDASGALCATYDEVAAAIYEEIADALASERGWYDALRAGGLALLRHLNTHPAEARLCFAEIHKGDHQLLRRRASSRRRLVSLFVRELGRRREEPELYAVQLELLIGASFQAIATAVSEGSVEQLEQLAPELESRAFVFEPVGA